MLLRSLRTWTVTGRSTIILKNVRAYVQNMNKILCHKHTNLLKNILKMVSISGSYQLQVILKNVWEYVQNMNKILCQKDINLLKNILKIVSITCSYQLQAVLKIVRDVVQNCSKNGWIDCQVCVLNLSKKWRFMFLTYSYFVSYYVHTCIRIMILKDKTWFLIAQ